jgi:hypothetical protein
MFCYRGMQERKGVIVKMAESTKRKTEWLAPILSGSS